MLNPCDFAETICRKCGKIFIGHWLSDGLCEECYYREKWHLSKEFVEKILRDELFLNLPIKEKISILSDWEHEHPEDREGIEEIKSALIDYLKKIIEYERKIVEIEIKANTMLRTGAW